MGMFRQRAERAQQTRGRKVICCIIESRAIMRNQRRRGIGIQVEEEQTKLGVGGEMRVKQRLRSSTALLHEIDPATAVGRLRDGAPARWSGTLEGGRENAENTRG